MLPVRDSSVVGGKRRFNWLSFLENPVSPLAFLGRPNLFVGFLASMGIGFLAVFSVLLLIYSPWVVLLGPLAVLGFLVVAVPMAVFSVLFGLGCLFLVWVSFFFCKAMGTRASLSDHFDAVIRSLFWPVAAFCLVSLALTAVLGFSILVSFLAKSNWSAYDANLWIALMLAIPLAFWFLWLLFSSLRRVHRFSFQKTGLIVLLLIVAGLTLTWLIRFTMGSVFSGFAPD